MERHHSPLLASAVATQEATDEDSNVLRGKTASEAAVAIRKPADAGNGYRATGLAIALSLSDDTGQDKASGRIQLFPAGTFAARDGRPGNLRGVNATSWRLTAQDAEAVIAHWQRTATPLVVDYEHQTQLAAQNGQPAPAAGWITSLEWEEGRGLFAGVDWTDKARAHIRAGEYRYISPVFAFDRQSDAVLRLICAALTNHPALGGQKAPDITEALAAVFGADYTLYCLPWAVQEQLTALREHLDKVSGPLEQRRATAWLGSTDTLSLCTTLAGQLNSGRISLACLPGSPSLPETLSAAYCAVAASEEDPARPLNTLALTGVAVPPESSRLSRTEQEVALKNGVTPLEVGPGEVVQIVRAISTYTRNAAGATDISLLDMTTIRTLDYVARTVKERIDLRFPREKLSTRTPPKVRSEVLDVLRQLEQLEIVEEVEANAAVVICERDLQDPNRLDCRIPSDVVNGLHVFAGVIDLRL